jgi:hypothetical protein
VSTTERSAGQGCSSSSKQYLKRRAHKKYNAGSFFFGFQANSSNYKALFTGIRAFFAATVYAGFACSREGGSSI